MGALFIPGRWCPPERPGMSHSAPAVSQRPALLPCSDNPSTGHPQSRDISQGFTRVHPSDLPLARGSPDGTGALRLSPELRTLPLPATHVGAGTDHLDTDQDLHHRHHRTSKDATTHNVRPRVAPPPCGVPVTGLRTDPSSITPARSMLRTSFRTPWSLTRSSTAAINRSCGIASKMDRGSFVGVRPMVID